MSRTPRSPLSNGDLHGWLVGGAIVCVCLAALDARAQSPLSALETRAERTGFLETTRYAEVVAFMRAVAEQSPRVHLTTFGYSLEGRPLPLAVVGELTDATPQAVLASGKLRVYLQANIHAGEVEGKESLLMLLRELAAGEHAAWSDSMVLLMAPIYNADGNERVSLINRPRQDGPEGGMGQRPNAQGLDLNRDHMKLESPEARSLARLLRQYDPHVAIDLHTTNGTHHGYHLTYAPPLHPNTSTHIVDFLRTQLLPSVTQAIKARDGWDFYYYGNVPPAQGDRERGWYTFDHRPRFNNNYIGLRNRIAILSEAYAYLTFSDRIVATSRFVEEILEYVDARADAVRDVVIRADAERVVGRDLAVRATFERSPAPVEILLGEVATDRHPLTGRPILRRVDTQISEPMPEFGTFRATQTERVPVAYFVPAALADTIDRLTAHGVALRRLEAPLRSTVEEFVIDSSVVAAQPFQGHRERSVDGRYVEVERVLPTDTWEVRLDQPLGRLIFLLLEPRSDDGFLNWNLLDDAIGEQDRYPIVRTFSPRP